jgi:hypothetical protein
VARPVALLKLRRADPGLLSEEWAMPLRDHFRLPLRGLCSWESFHSGWANEIMRQLNNTLPPGYVARPNVKLGVDVETDDGALEQLDLFEVRIHREGGLEMVAAVELVSPHNKDRQTARRHFASKCAAYLQSGVSVILVDVVTTRKENLYAALLDQLSLPPDDADEGQLYAVACRSTPPDESNRLESWVKQLQLGSLLPILPLWLESDLAVPLNLEKSYEATCVELRVAI